MSPLVPTGIYAKQRYNIKKNLNKNDYRLNGLCQYIQY